MIVAVCLFSCIFACSKNNVVSGILINVLYFLKQCACCLCIFCAILKQNIKSQNIKKEEINIKNRQKKTDRKKKMQKIRISNQIFYM